MPDEIKPEIINDKVRMEVDPVTKEVVTFIAYATPPERREKIPLVELQKRADVAEKNRASWQARIDAHKRLTDAVTEVIKP